jgi:hypothetical protein
MQHAGEFNVVHEEGASGEEPGIFETELIPAEIPGGGTHREDPCARWAARAIAETMFA